LQNAVLSAENYLLKQQVAFLQGMLGGQPNAAAATTTTATTEDPVWVNTEGG